MTKYQIFAPNGLKTCIIEASSIVHTPEFSVLYGKWIKETNTFEPICTLFAGFQAVPLESIIEDDFKLRLKEICLKCDKEYGQYPDRRYIGETLYDFYCLENGLNLDYPDQQQYEYIESDEPITQIGEVVCPAGDISYRGRVFGINGDDIYIDFPKKVAMINRHHLKKVISKEII